MLAFVDELTGLRNKNGLIEDFKNRSLENKHFIYVDIDDFKKMNVVFGTDVGDRILLEVTKSLREYCDNTDVYRIGVGQFILVTESHIMCEPSELQRILIQPVVLEQLQLVVNASICVLDHDDFPDDGLIDLLKYMQSNIDGAKLLGKNQLVYCDQKAKENFYEKKEIVDNLFFGVNNGQFYPKFQPFIDTYTNEIVGLEAVSRWDMFGTMLRPRCFLDAAEWTGLIYDIEMQIFKEAVRFFRELLDDKDIKVSPRFKVAVHFSAYTLKRVDIYELLKILKEFRISQKDIIIETKEKYILDVSAYEKIKQFREKQFMVMLDEYSNSDASLSFLADLKIDAIKLSEKLLEYIDSDQEFTRMMNVYKFMVEISKKLDITVVSDGINSLKNARLVKDLEVHIGLGKFYSRAVVKDEFIEFMMGNKKKRFR
jgi:diguanylate cyclase (GGDEF)-like protein